MTILTALIQKFQIVYFIIIKIFFKVYRGDLLIDNCTFKNTDGDEKESMASIMVSKFLNNKITIKNTIFKSNIVEKNMPLFYFFKTNIEFQNTTFINNYSTSGHLMQLEYINKNYTEKFTISDSFFSENDCIINGKNNDININNCEFMDTNLKSVLPIVANCVYSNIQVENSKFENLNIQGNGILGSESNYIIKNVTFSDIITNGKSLFKFLNKNIEFIDVKLDNVKKCW
ncbi:hypothetical protein BCR36DRAFT_442369 [Piromyces finnis]|uniref:Right handed beta helix domain-containing protein n=1 Tax=Piromyces finnis TaxID=1754191 RepID=A0A1Y1VE41_9FUNG|nr:hypothetical protein BCR36DRAFT_442369 [Piromyces finnis]|eukprot:ORX53828.1 hypothetical protein BCR36DRAFT_442369 [Piromyces finnis]